MDYQFDVDPLLMTEHSRTLHDLGAALARHQYAFADAHVNRLNVTEAFDRAYWAMSWALNQVARESDTELAGDGDSITDTLGDFYRLEQQNAATITTLSDSLGEMS